jgi:acetyl-CoA synthetase
VPQTFFNLLGLKTGDAVVLVLKRRYEYWHCVVTLHELGAFMVLSTHLLTVKDVKNTG